MPTAHIFAIFSSSYFFFSLPLFKTFIFFHSFSFSFDSFYVARAKKKFHSYFCCFHPFISDAAHSSFSPPFSGNSFCCSEHYRNLFLFCIFQALFMASMLHYIDIFRMMVLKQIIVSVSCFMTASLLCEFSPLFGTLKMTLNIQIRLIQQRLLLVLNENCFRWRTIAIVICFVSVQ